MFEQFIKKDFSTANSYAFFQSIVNEFQNNLILLDTKIVEKFNFQHTKDKNNKLALWITYVSHPDASIGEHSASKIFLPFSAINEVMVDKENKVLIFGKIAIAL